MQQDITHLIKLNNKIFRNTQGYLDKRLKPYELSSGSYPYLLILSKNEGISQNKISKEIGYDKAMSARTISKLIKLGYLDRKKDDMDSRANKLYLTSKAKTIIPNILREIHDLVHLIAEDLNEEEQSITMASLNKILTNMKKINL